MNNKILVSAALGLSLTAACTTMPTNTANTANTGNKNTAVVTNTNTNANTTASPMNTNTNANTAKTDGGHEHTAPHNGTLVAFGEEFAHVELVLDKATGKLTAYTLDGEAEKGVAVEQPEMEIAITKPSAMTVKLMAVESTLSGSKKGAATEFSGQADGLKGLSNFEASIKLITIKGKPFNSTAFKFPEGNEEKHADAKKPADGKKDEKHTDGKH